MADLLESLESVLSRSIGLAQKLHAYLGRIDEHMNHAAREREERGVKHTRGVGIGRETSSSRSTRREPPPPVVPETGNGFAPGVNLDPALFGDLPNTWDYPYNLSSLAGMAETFVPQPVVNTEAPTSMQIQLPEALQADWPFGTDQAFDFLGNW